MWRTLVIGAVATVAIGCGDDAGTGGAGAGATGTGLVTGPGAGGSSGTGSCFTELCDGFDNDCDGEVDEDCTCVHGAEQPCYVGQDGTEGVGVCHGGRSVCENGNWGSCIENVAPSDELCNSLDDDCDGIVDQACPLWMKEIPASPDGALGVGISSTGDVVIVGTAYGNIDLGGGILPGSGNDDGFVAQYDEDGTFEWAHRIGSTGDDDAQDVVVATDGSVYVVGRFATSVDFGAGAVTSLGSYDAYLVKYDAAGVLQWSVVGGGTGSDGAKSVAIDGTGDVLVVGTFEGTASFGAATVLDGTNGKTFVARFDPSGVPQSTVNIGSTATSDDAVSAVVAEADGDYYVTGQFSGTGKFGGTDLVAVGTEIFLAKYDAANVHQWSKKFGPASIFVDTWSTDLALAPSGDLIITGRAEATLDLGGGPIAGNGEVFLASLHPDGSHGWSLRSEGGFNENFGWGEGVAVAADGDILLAGWFDGRVNFGSSPLHQVTSSNEVDALFASFSATGAHQWSENLRGTVDDADDYAKAVAVGPGGVVAVAGESSSRVMLRLFGPDGT